MKRGGVATQNGHQVLYISSHLPTNGVDFWFVNLFNQGELNVRFLL